MGRLLLQVLAVIARLASPLLHRLPQPPRRAIDRAYAPASRFLRQVAGPGGRLLVVGGIRDTDRTHFLSHFRSIVIDLQPGPQVTLRGDAQHLPFRGASVDAAMAQGVLNHVEDLGRVLGELRRAIRPGGALYANTAFLLAHHPEPIDRMRPTGEGWRRLLAGWEIRQLGTSVGPLGAIYLLALHVVERAIEAPHLRHAMWFLAGHLLRPLLWLDGRVAAKPWSMEGAAGIYALAIRPRD